MSRPGKRSEFRAAKAHRPLDWRTCPVVESIVDCAQAWLPGPGWPGEYSPATWEELNASLGGLRIEEDRMNPKKQKAKDRRRARAGGAGVGSGQPG